MNVRMLAFDILNKVYKDKAFINLELNHAINDADLKVEDKAFLTTLCYGVLQRSIYLDYVIKKSCQGKKIEPKMRTLLKLALYQIYYLDRVPNYAIVNESVNIAKEVMGLYASKFVNAVLHNLIRNPFVLNKDDFKDEISYLCVQYSHPEWLIRMIAKQYGVENSIEYMKKNMTPPRVSMRVNTLKSKIEDHLEKDYFEKGNLSPVALTYTGKKSISELEEFKNGFMVVQDESSQMVAEIASPKKGSKILDMCAAPGSKTYHLASKIENDGHIVAIDLYDHRVQLLKNQLKRLGVSCVETFAYDSTKLLDKYQEESFDMVVLDAPCSGFGVIRRKPDMFFNLVPDSLDEIIKLQQDLIDVAVKLVKKGGTLVYSTCTINKKENEKQIEYLNAKYPGFKVVEQKLIFPFEYDTDGFFICKLEKE